MLEAAQRCLCPEQLGPQGIKDRLGPNVEPGPFPAQPLEGPLQLGSGALGATDRLGQQQAVVGGQQRPAPRAPAGEARALDQLAQQQITLAVAAGGDNPHLVLPPWLASAMGRRFWVLRRRGVDA